MLHSTSKKQLAFASCSQHSQNSFLLPENMRANVNVVLVSLLVFLAISSCNGGQLSPVFYRKSCPQLGRIVRNITWSKVAANPAFAAKLLRLHYHDCFVQVGIHALSTFDTHTLFYVCTNNIDNCDHVLVHILFELIMNHS